ncbi:hypothetical protein [Microbacterium sp. OR16]|uniref:hypothetical protein n=1 Tax=Microbacterium sp. OR16 TaxID=3095345 RepID=UPI0039B68C99
MLLAAALVLVFSDRTKLRAAATQGTAPLLAVIALTVWMLGAAGAQPSRACNPRGAQLVGSTGTPP